VKKAKTKHRSHATQTTPLALSEAPRRTSPSRDFIFFCLALVVTILSIELDKGGKFTGNVLYAMLFVAALFSLPPVLGTPLIAKALPTRRRWLNAIAVTLVGVVYVTLGLWIMPSKTVPTEAQRRQEVLDHLRNEYVQSHSGLSPDVLAGTQPPPVEWINSRLKELGEGWTIGRQHPLQLSSFEFSPIVAGQPVAVRLHFANPDGDMKIRASWLNVVKKDLTNDYNARRELEDELWNRLEARILTNAKVLSLPAGTDANFSVESTATLTKRDVLAMQNGETTYYLMMILVPDTEAGSSPVNICIHTIKTSLTEHSNCIAH